MKNLSRTYVIALSIIALVIGLSQFLVQYSISSTNSDARVINISGRQRMLSQKISKATLSMANSSEQSQFEKSKSELASAYTLWKDSHNALQFGSVEMQIPSVNNSDEILALFEQIVPYYTEMAASADYILNANTFDEMNEPDFQVSLNRILRNEGDFLKLMNDITFQYDAESTSRVSDLSRNEYILFAIAILLLVAEAFVIFRPAMNRIANYTKQLLAKEESLKKALIESQYLSNQAKSIFDNVGQGIFLLDSDLIIDSFYSKETERAFYQHNLAGMNFIQIMKPRLKQRDIEALNLFAENLFNTEIREGVVNKLNPVEQVEIFNEGENEDSSGGIESRFLRISFSRIIRDNEIYRVLVTVVDETESVMLKRQIEEAEERNEQEAGQLLAILKVNPKILTEYLNKSIKSLSLISKRYEENKDQDFNKLINFTFRVIHNAKGNASLIGLGLLEDKLHKIEDTITELKHNKNVAGKDFLKVIYEVTEIIVVLKNMQVLLSKIANVYRTWNEEDQQQSSNELLISTLKKGVTKLSNYQKKSVKFEFHDNDLALPDTYKIDVKDLAIQLIRNSMVHSIEDPDDRKFEGKPETATITISLKQDKNGGTVLNYEDDGRGLDHYKIANQALTRGIITASDLSVMSDDEKANLIFVDGFSTADSVNKLGGRGQGMSIIKSIVKKHNGRYQIHSVKNEYFRITISFPKAQSAQLKKAS